MQKHSAGHEQHVFWILMSVGNAMLYMFLRSISHGENSASQTIQESDQRLHLDYVIFTTINIL